MTDAEILAEVKARLNITGTYQDNALSGFISDTKFYLIDAGVNSALINTDASVGVIFRGVSDLWNYGETGGKFSEFFYQRAKQLTLNEVDPDG